MPIKIQLTKDTDAVGQMRLFAQTTDGTTVPPQLVPSSWLFTAEPPALPQGWTLSANLDGSGVVYTRAQIQDSTIVLTDATGAKHTWTKQSSAAATARQLMRTACSRWTRAAGSRSPRARDVYVFNSDGTLASESSVADALKPATLQDSYSGSPTRLTQITDPVSGQLAGAALQSGWRLLLRQHARTRRQWTRSPLPRNAVQNQLLGRHRNRSVVHLRSRSAVDPEPRQSTRHCTPTRVTDCSDTWPMTWLNDWVRAGSGQPQHHRHLHRDRLHQQRWRVAADEGDLACARNPDAPRPEHDYRFDPANQQAFVDEVGLHPAVGFATKVTYDSADRMLTSTDADWQDVEPNLEHQRSPVDVNRPGRPGVDLGVRLRRPRDRQVRAGAHFLLRPTGADDGLRRLDCTHPHQL